MANKFEQSQPGVAVHLIDPGQGHTVQSWQFREQSTITIGRAEDCDVVIVDPYVSRSHVELRHRDGQWWLLSTGRHGVLVDGRTVSEAPLDDGLVFRLGVAGPSLRFEDRPQGPKNSATLDFDPDAIVVLRMDEAAIKNEVSEIAEGEYFQKLKRQAHKLREQRKG